MEATRRQIINKFQANESAKGTHDEFYLGRIDSINYLEDLVNLVVECVDEVQKNKNKAAFYILITLDDGN